MNVYISTQVGNPQQTRIVPELEVANKLLDKGAFEDARILYDQIYLLSKDPEALYGMALCVFRKGDAGESLKVIQELLQRVPNHAAAFNLAGVISLTLKDVPAAKSMFAAAITQDPGMIEAQRNFGESLLEEGSYKDGLEVFLKILENHPEDIPTLMRMAELCAECGRRQESNEYLLRVLQVEPEHPSARTMLEHSQES